MNIVKYYTKKEKYVSKQSLTKQTALWMNSVKHISLKFQGAWVQYANNYIFSKVFIMETSLLQAILILFGTQGKLQNNPKKNITLNMIEWLYVVS